MKVALLNNNAFVHCNGGKITLEDRIVIKALRVQKNCSSCRFLKEFPSKVWCRQSLDRLIKKVDAGLPVDGLIGRSRRRPVRSAAIQFIDQSIVVYVVFGYYIKTPGILRVYYINIPISSGGVVCRLSYKRMVNILNISSTRPSCRHLYSTTLLFFLHTL